MRGSLRALAFIAGAAERTQAVVMDEQPPIPDTRPKRRVPRPLKIALLVTLLLVILGMILLAKFGPQIGRSAGINH